MSNGGDLLRMLMPAIRPVPVPGSTPRSTPGSTPGADTAGRNLPIESRSFDSLLKDVRLTEVPGEAPLLNQADNAAQDTAQAPDPGEARPQTYRPLFPLAGIDSIHNASLRRIIAEAADGR